MAKKGLGKGLGAIFGTDINRDTQRVQHKKTVAESLAEGALEKKTKPQELEMTEGVSEEEKAEEILSKEASGETGKAEVADDEAVPGTEYVDASVAEEKRITANEMVLTSADEAQKDMKMVRLSLLQPNLAQPRKHFDEEALQELAESIRSFGVLQPLLVKQQGALYEIIAGERRWRAAKLAGLTEVPVLIRELDAQASREVSIIENIQRADLNAVEEALAYQSLISEYGLTQEEVAARVSKKRSTITNSLRILKLEPEILSMLRDGQITQGHARALLAIEDPQLRMKIAERCERDGLSVREIETLVKLDKLSRNQKKKGEDEESAELKRLKLIYKDLEKKMKAMLGTKVSIVPKDKNKGILEIEYYSQDELDRIFMMLNSITKEA